MLGYQIIQPERLIKVLMLKLQLALMVLSDLMLLPDHKILHFLQHFGHPVHLDLLHGLPSPELFEHLLPVVVLFAAEGFVGGRGLWGLRELDYGVRAD
jgi:hypothetical protein